MFHPFRRRGPRHDGKPDSRLVRIVSLLLALWLAYSLVCIAIAFS